MCMGGDVPEDKSAEIEAKRQARIQQGTQAVDDTFKGFDDAFYAGRTKAYNDNYAPQLDKQYKEANDALINRLGGNINGSEGAKAFGELTKQYEEQKARMIENGINYGNDTRMSLSNQRSQLISQLEGGGSIENAGSMATNYAAGLARPQQFSPLANLFSSGSAQFANANNASSNGYAPVDTSVGLFNGTGSKTANRNVG